MISDTKLTFISVVSFSIVLLIFGFVFGEIVSGIETKRSLAYTVVATTIGVGIIAAIVKLKRYERFLFAAAVLFGLETLFASTFVVQDKRHHAATAWVNYDRAAYVDRFGDQFTHHSMLEGMPTPNYQSEEINHTAFSTRKTTPPKTADAPTIVTIGGSTTYGTDGDENTWSSLLAQQANLNVVNMGVLGYSSAEHVVQTAFWAPEFNPQCAVYYVGWNDLRSVGVNDIRPDYSGFHGKRQGMMLGVSPNAFKFYQPNALEYVATFQAYINWRRTRLENFLSDNFPWWRDNTGAGIITAETNPEALAYFIQNMETIITINKARGVKTILIPQVMNYDMLEEEDARPWTPFLSAKAMRNILGEYNRTLVAMADEENVFAIEEVLDLDWRDELFIDEGHFNPAGAKLFADGIVNKVASVCGGETSTPIN